VPMAIVARQELRAPVVRHLLDELARAAEMPGTAPLVASVPAPAPAVAA
jgi:hypothetical protein